MSVFSKKRRVPATILRIWYQPPPGAPWYYWVYVLFESRGDRSTIHLKEGQAKKFVKRHSEGDTGYLEFKGDHMLTWAAGSPSD